jgi:hypothetical protein
MSMCLPYICGFWAAVAALFLSLAALGSRDLVRGVASRKWSILARGAGLLIAAVATIVVSYVLWVRWVGLPWP